MQADQLVKAGHLAAALTELQAAVRKQPQDDKLRVFLFQLLVVLGQWERALTQLQVATELNGQHLLMAQIYRAAVACEPFRAAVFAGQQTPLVFGEPPDWVAPLLQALQLAGNGEWEAAQPLRDQAFAAAPAIAGQVDGVDFAWVADADLRLGPMLEAIIDGRYFWIPYCRISSITLEPPQDLRDLVWAQAQFVWTNGGTSAGLIPVRYPGSAGHPDGQLALARKTEWQDRPGGYSLGLGQRLLATDQADFALLSVTNLQIGPVITPVVPPVAGAAGG